MAVAIEDEKWAELNTQVLFISTDSPFVHKAWQDGELSDMMEGGIPYPMLSDPGGKIGSLYGVYDDEAGIDIRGRFLISPDGILLAAEILTADVGRNVDEMIRQVEAYQHVMETGEVTPAGWHPGEMTLKPGPDLVGKVGEIWKPNS